MQPLFRTSIHYSLFLAAHLFIPIIAISHVDRNLLRKNLRRTSFQGPCLQKEEAHVSQEAEADPKAQQRSEEGGVQGQEHVQPQGRRQGSHQFLQPPSQS